MPDPIIQITDLKDCRLRSMPGARMWRTSLNRSRTARSVAALRPGMSPIFGFCLRQQITVPFGQTSAWSRRGASLVQHISALSLKVLSLPSACTRCWTQKRQETIWCTFFSHVWNRRWLIDPVSGPQLKQLHLLDGVVASSCLAFHFDLPSAQC